MPRERYHPLTPRPLRVTDAPVLEHRVGKVGLPLLGYQPYLVHTNWYAAVRIIYVRVHPRARLQHQHSPALIKCPDSCEGCVEMMDQYLDTPLQHRAQIAALGDGLSYLCSQVCQPRPLRKLLL